VGDDAEGLVVLGRVSGLYGVRGWVKVFSFTEPRDRILGYSPWLLRESGAWRERVVTAGRPQGKGLVAALEGVTDRDQARLLMGAEIAVRPEQLPELEEGEYYWRDLIGLQVATTAGADLGTVTGLLETGANDVLVVRGERERLVPFLPGRVVTAVDLAAGTLTVDWDPDF
jgi:16S rRNA processing protein RimM